MAKYMANMAKYMANMTKIWLRRAQRGLRRGQRGAVRKEKDHAKCNVKKRHGIPKKQSKTAEIRQKTTWDTPKTTCLQRGLRRGSKRVTEGTKMTATIHVYSCYSTSGCVKVGYTGDTMEKWVGQSSGGYM